MGGGYHSRSPEEFRKFLDESRKKSSGGKFSRIRLIFILNLVLVVLVIGMVARAMNPSSFGVQATSPKIKLDSIVFYVKSAREGKSGFPAFFLFMKNENESKELRFPNGEWKFKLALNSPEGIECISDEWIVPERNLFPGKIEFARFRWSDETVSKLPPDCRTDSDPSFLERIFHRINRQSGLTLRLSIEHSGKSETLNVENL
ncbi:hypothetical protein EHQ12_03215 [Leptospira gomenensis]|uniref:Uncharacterized protein n=1 Tax=Leptospira gomenensis TaxID=2484974 RepID=A0A5F1Z010_9LEPT|nr:hypothetical protein [Leptospira gomenensis]TGK31067.1 hypothetical protein EHQ17_15250 [Leptospira gomenensis]TGK43271.1 hypothetical protein EHQ12_03215 [Leptospira gomenensis]TGK45214.1 hypothetical protein EHQ07_09750 [Leptospira gomenensis]TGK66128.1 hypothetical protein EHQ13_03485 [Leptospira gomenensis]